MSYLTVCTPTYNRAYILDRPFRSLMAQTFKDFEWLIIDDGSTDDTEKKVKEFIEKADFPIYYHKQKNLGRAAALNTSYKYITTKYVINLDSDDAYVPDALQKIHDIWENIPSEEYDRYWCVTGQCIDSQTGKLIGGLWPEGINQLRGRQQHKAIVKYKKGEKSCCRKTEILKQYPFPQYDDTKFVPENIVWEKINLYYDQFCTNEIFRIYYTDSVDSLAKGVTLGESQKNSQYHLMIFMINELFGQFFYNPSIPKVIPKTAYWAILSRKSYGYTMEEINKWYKRALVSICWPLMMLYTRKIGK